MTRTLVWYAAYGSNTDEARFRQYLVRCHGDTEPLESRAHVIDLPLYFAGRSSRRWGDGGVAFVDVARDPAPSTLARLWLLPADVVVQIGELEGAWYDTLAPCGELDGIPVVTLASSVRREPANAPGRAYASVVAAGLRASHGLDARAVAEYLAPRTMLPIPTLVAWQTGGAGEQGTE